MKSNVLYIQTFGNFKLTYNDREFLCESIGSKQLCVLLSFLIANRFNDCSRSRLYEVLWEGKELENHANALKNLSYRLRNLLNSKLGIDGNEYISSKQGSYVWNIDSEYDLDLDRFEELTKSIAFVSGDKEQVMELHKKSFDIYKGDFLPDAIYKDWTMPIRVYYQNQFMKIADELAKYYINMNHYVSAEVTALKAINVDKYKESNHRNLMIAYIGQNKYKKALEHYYEIQKMYFNEFGEKPSSIITEIYDSISIKSSLYFNTINDIKGELDESEPEGTMFVNYEEFKAIYRLKKRLMMRENSHMYLTIITLKFNDYVRVDDDKEKKLLKKIECILCNILRKGDVFSLCGKMQFAIILANINKENTKLVVERFKKCAYKDLNNENFLITYQIDEVSNEIPELKV